MGIKLQTLTTENAVYLTETRRYILDATSMEKQMKLKTSIVIYKDT
jgi:hypothetical protein